MVKYIYCDNMIETHVGKYSFCKLYTVEFSEKLVIKAAVIKTAIYRTFLHS